MKLYDSIKRFQRDERGVSLVFAAFAITGIMLAAGISIDLSRYYLAKAQLNASVQQAALGGATNFYPYVDSTTQVRAAANAVLTANAMPSLMTTTAASITFRCSNELKTNTLKYVTMKSASATCSNVNQANVVRVYQTATVNLAFARFLKTNSLGIYAMSEAMPFGSLTTSAVKKPANIAIIVDTTASMSTTDNNCKNANGTALSRLDCVKMGLSYLFNGLAGADAKLQLLTFPPIDSTNNGGNVGEDVCNPSGSINIGSKYGNYNGTPYAAANEQYTVIPSVSAGGPPTAVATNTASYMKDTTMSGVLNPNSPFYKALGAYANGDSKPINNPSCTGLQNPGGLGTYYGDSLAWARNNLTFNNDGTRQDVIILLSDGQANATKMPTAVDPGSGTGNGNFKANGTAVPNVVKSLTLNGVSGGGDASHPAYGIQNTSKVFTTPGTNSFPGSSTNGSCISNAAHCGTTTNKYVTCSRVTGSTCNTSGSPANVWQDQCKAAAQYADQLAEYSPKVNGTTSLDVPMIYSYFYGDQSGTNGCTTETDNTYTSCYTMKQIASDVTKTFFSVDSTCPGNNGTIVDISAAFGQLVFDLTGTSGRSRIVPPTITTNNL
jgi:Flp pilus assembly protein TadG